MSSQMVPRPRGNEVISDAQDEREVKLLVAKLKTGDRKALAEIMRRYQNQILSLAFKMTRDYDDAADIAQAVFVKMARSIDRYDPSKRFYTWLYRIAVNASIDHIRKHQRHRHEPLDVVSNLGDSFRLNPEFQFMTGQLRQHLLDATDTLTDKQQES